MKVVPRSMTPRIIEEKNLAREHFEKYPFKETSKFSKVIDMIPQSHEQARGVSYPSQQISAGYHILLLYVFLCGIVETRRMKVQTRLVPAKD